MADPPLHVPKRAEDVSYRHLIGPGLPLNGLLDRFEQDAF
jgi:hypothetical protein